MELSQLCGQFVYLAIFDKDKQKLVQYSSHQDFTARSLAVLNNATLSEELKIESYDNSCYDYFASHYSKNGKWRRLGNHEDSDLEEQKKEHLVDSQQEKYEDRVAETFIISNKVKRKRKSKQEMKGADKRAEQAEQVQEGDETVNSGRGVAVSEAKMESSEHRQSGLETAQSDSDKTQATYLGGALEPPQLATGIAPRLLVEPKEKKTDVL